MIALALLAAARAAPPITWELVARYDDGAAVDGGRVVRDGIDVGHAGLGYAALVDPDDAWTVQARAARRGRAVDLRPLVRVVDGPGDRVALEALAARLRADPDVVWAQVVARGVPPPGDLDPRTPDLTGRQGYADPDPGIDVLAAWDVGFTGASLAIADCEYGWILDHEDLVDLGVETEPGQDAHPLVAEYGFDQHGTSVLGQTSAPDNGYGVTGLVPDAHVRVFSEYTTRDGPRREAAIAAAVAASAPGDVVILEMQALQAGQPDGAYGPAELDRAVWEISRAATDAGVIVVGAAGNGAQDLDSGTYATYRSWGDSGAILAGAGSPDRGHDALWFSTFGAAVDVQGWGSEITTLGYGDYGQYGGTADLRQYYTAAFGGTSGATPIVASAAAIVSEAITAITGAPADPAEVRDVLIASGIPQGAGGNIGPMPDLAAALAEVRARFGPGLLRVRASEVPTEGAGLTLTADVWWTGDAAGSVTWAFPDGRTATGPTATATFPDDGPAVVTLTLADPSGAEATRTWSFDVANVAPTVTAVAPTRRPRVGREVELTADVVEPGDDTVTLTWTLPDGTTAVGNPVIVTFPDRGDAEVTIVATDEDGGRSEATFPVRVRSKCGCDGVGGAPWAAGVAAALLARRRQNKAGRS